MDKPEALLLAESAHLGYRIGWQRQAAAELRRLARVEAQRDALLEMLKLARSIIGHPDDAHSQMIDAAIKAVEEGK